MSDRKWTPGPWKWSADHPTNACANVSNEERYVSIATLYGGDSDSFQDAEGMWSAQPIRDANARLIAAAPDLYEALDELSAWLSLGDHDTSQEQDLAMVARVNAALAKARGGT